MSRLILLFHKMRGMLRLLAILSVFLPILYAGGGGGADYHNTICGPLYFLTLALLVASIADQSRLFAGYAGAAAAAALHTNPLLILLVPLVTLQSLAICRTYKRSAAFISTAIGISLVGFACGTIGLGLISAAFGRGFFFFKPQIDYIHWIQQENHNVWWRQFSWDWFGKSKANSYLIGVFIICLVELVAVAVRRRTRDAGQAISAYAGYVLSYLLAVGYQFNGQTTLQPDYLNYMLVVATFTPLGYLFERYLPPLSNRSLAILFAVIPLACASALIGSGRIYETLHLVSLSSFTLVTVTLAAVYLALVAFSTTRLNLAVVLLPLLMVALIPYPGLYTYDSCRAVQYLNVFISEASMLATKIAGHPQRVYVFADPRESMTKPCFENISLAYLGGSFVAVAHKYLGKPFGEQQLDQLTHDDFAGVIRDDGIIAVLVTQDAAEDRFVETAAKLGIDLQLAGLLPHSISGVKLYFFRPRVE